MFVPNPPTYRPAPVADWRWKSRVVLLTWTACGLVTGLLFLVASSLLPAGEAPGVGGHGTSPVSLEGTQ
jgi:hypothetical protein